MLDDKIGVVLYTDGSARPNPGKIGWGVHGYLYELVDLKKPVSVDNHIITNRGYSKNFIAEGSVAVNPTNYFDFFGSSLEDNSNNKAEILALINGLERIEQYKPKTIHILTDSEYVKNGILIWCKSWERNNWLKEGIEIKNADVWKQAYFKVKDLIAKGTIFDIEWVKGHNEIFGNTHADILAVVGMNHSTAGRLYNEFTVSAAKDYWKEEIEKHPFLNFKRLYFNSVSSYNIPGQYFQADPGAGDFFIGKRIPETGYSVVKLYEQDDAVEAIKQKQFEVADDANAIIMMKLDRVYSKEIFPYLKLYGKYCLLADTRNLNLNFIDKKPVTIEVNPTGLSLRAIDSFNMLDNMIAEFAKYKNTGYVIPENLISLNFHDITSTFYRNETKKVKKETVDCVVLKEEYTSGFRDLTIKINEVYDSKVVSVPVPIILGTDLPPRNNLKKLEDHNPKVYLITWRESTQSIRYATIIDCDTGVGIWSNFFADKIFLSNF